MFSFETPRDDWEANIKPYLIEDRIREICANISKKGDQSSFPDIFQTIYEYIEDNLEKFINTGDVWH